MKKGERKREREREGVKEREMYNMAIEFISLLLTMAALQLTRIVIFIFKRNDGHLGTF